MRVSIVLLAAAALLGTSAPALAAGGGPGDGFDGECYCSANHWFQGGCSVSGPCPCECRCPFIGGCSCQCAGYQIDRPPAG